MTVSRRLRALVEPGLLRGDRTNGIMRRAAWLVFLPLERQLPTQIRRATYKAFPVRSGEELPWADGIWNPRSSDHKPLQDPAHLGRGLGLASAADLARPGESLSHRPVAQASRDHGGQNSTWRLDRS